LDDEVKDVRKSAAWALGEIGVDPKAIDPLIQALKDEDREVREEAEVALVKIGEPAVAQLINTLKDEDEEIRKYAAWALGEIGGARSATRHVRILIAEALIQALKDEDEEVRLTAALSLDKIGWIPVNDDEKAWYLVAKREWSEVAFIGNPAVEPLVQALKSDDGSIQWGATKALVKIGNSAVEPLIQALEDEDAQFQAAITLEIIGNERAKEAVDEFIREYNADLEYIAENCEEVIEQDISGMNSC
jgi:HEAT repeat protein